MGTGEMVLLGGAAVAAWWFLSGRGAAPMAPANSDAMSMLGALLGTAQQLRNPRAPYGVVHPSDPLAGLINDGTIGPANINANGYTSTIQGGTGGIDPNFYEGDGSVNGYGGAYGTPAPSIPTKKTPTSTAEKPFKQTVRPDGTIVRDYRTGKYTPTPGLPVRQPTAPGAPLGTVTVTGMGPGVHLLTKPMAPRAQTMLTSVPGNGAQPIQGGTPAARAVQVGGTFTPPPLARPKNTSPAGGAVSVNGGALANRAARVF